jgi:hypothetical protein
MNQTKYNAKDVNKLVEETMKMQIPYQPITKREKT